MPRPSRITLVVVGSAVVTVLALVTGLGTVAGLLALVHLGGGVGAPLAARLASRARSVPLLVVLSMGLSLATTAVAAQSLLWFGLAHAPLIVVAATCYGVALAELLPAAPATAAGRGTGTATRAPTR